MPTPFEDAHMYKASHGTPSTVGPQIRIDYFWKKALVEAAKEQYFGQLADVVSMPKHMGKTIKKYHYLPILDDENVNDQGIDAYGVSAQTDFVVNQTYVKVNILATAPASLGGDVYGYEAISQDATDEATAYGKALAQVEGRMVADLVMRGLIGYNTTVAQTIIDLGADGWTIVRTPAAAGTDASVAITGRGTCHGICPQLWGV